VKIRLIWQYCFHHLISFDCFSVNRTAGDAGRGAAGECLNVVLLLSVDSGVALLWSSWLLREIVVLLLLVDSGMALLWLPLLLCEVVLTT
jgi:hypothetical protein